jgi:hypothetical protein
MRGTLRGRHRARWHKIGSPRGPGVQHTGGVQQMGPVGRWRAKAHAAHRWCVKWVSGLSFPGTQRQKGTQGRCVGAAVGLLGGRPGSRADAGARLPTCFAAAAAVGGARGACVGGCGAVGRAAGGGPRHRSNGLKGGRARLPGFRRPARAGRAPHHVRPPFMVCEPRVGGDMHMPVHTAARGQWGPVSFALVVLSPQGAPQYNEYKAVRARAVI